MITYHTINDKTYYRIKSQTLCSELQRRWSRVSWLSQNCRKGLCQGISFFDLVYGFRRIKCLYLVVHSQSSKKRIMKSVSYKKTNRSLHIHVCIYRIYGIRRLSRSCDTMWCPFWVEWSGWMVTRRQCSITTSSTEVCAIICCHASNITIFYLNCFS